MEQTNNNIPLKTHKVLGWELTDIDELKIKRHIAAAKSFMQNYGKGTIIGKRLVRHERDYK